MTLRAPVPYWGGKAAAANVIWQRLGDPDRYIEPFAGMLGCLLNRPHEPRVEIANDLDGLVCNFWRATTAEPDAVWSFADRPLHECDMRAFRIRLSECADALTDRLHADDRHYDVETAAIWMWLAGAAINPRSGKAHIHHRGHGIHAAGFRPTVLHVLRARCRNVSFLCGEWQRACTPRAMDTDASSSVAVLFDPPYDNERRTANCYRRDDGSVTSAVLQWCVDHSDTDVRIALCGLDGEYDLHETHGWDVVAWKGSKNNERIWFSTACLPAHPTQGVLFS